MCLQTSGQRKMRSPAPNRYVRWSSLSEATNPTTHPDFKIKWTHFCKSELNSRHIYSAVLTSMTHGNSFCTRMQPFVVMIIWRFQHETAVLFLMYSSIILVGNCWRGNAHCCCETVRPSNVFHHWHFHSFCFQINGIIVWGCIVHQFSADTPPSFAIILKLR